MTKLELIHTAIKLCIQADSTEGLEDQLAELAEWTKEIQVSTPDPVDRYAQSDLLDDIAELKNKIQVYLASDEAAKTLEFDYPILPGPKGEH